MKQLILCFMMIVGFTLTACNNGTSSSSSKSQDQDPVESSDGYTLIVGAPYDDGTGNQAAQFYSDLLNRIQTQSNFRINRIVVNVDSPTINPDIYGLGTTVANSGMVVGFFESVAIYNLTAKNKVEIYTEPDVESAYASAWDNMTIPAGATSIPSCSNAATEADPNQKAMLMSICWTSYVNSLISTAIESSAKSIIGAAYDHQGVAYADTQWVSTQTTGDGLYLGWLSSGMQPYVNLNLIEVYDLSKGSTSAPRVDTIAPETVWTVVQGLTPSYSNGLNTYTGVFPGTQWITATSPTSLESGEVGANIYQCAIASTVTLSSFGCNSTYTSGVDITQTPDVQMMQSLQYIFMYPTDIPSELSSNIYGTAPVAPAPAYSAVVYLFSTQYIGPINSYAGSGTQCTESAGNCSCVASAYNPIASCGDENGFGSWGHDLMAFKSFSDKFLKSQSCGSGFTGGCGVGMWKYDFIPQQWFY